MLIEVSHQLSSSSLVQMICHLADQLNKRTGRQFMKVIIPGATTMGTPAMRPIQMHPIALTLIMNKELERRTKGSS